MSTMWFHIASPLGSYEFDLEKEEATNVYNLITMLMKDEAGFVQIPTSKNSITLFSADMLKQSVIQIGGIK